MTQLTTVKKDQKIRTHCKHGHPWTEENIYVMPNGKKVCKVCKKEKLAKLMRRRRGDDCIYS